MGQRNVIELILKGTDAGVSSMLGKLGGGLSGLGSVAAGALGVLAGNLMTSAIGKIGELGRSLANDLINEAPRLEGVRRTFNSLAADIGEDADVMMSAMREATRGMVSDAGLMEASNKLVAMGLAASSSEAAELAEVATQLGVAMGEDATASMENFALMMSNQSLPRLDSFGISSGAVRERIIELMEATEGLTREEAFNAAVMEQAAVAMERVGEQGEGTAGIIGNFQTSLQNLKDGALAALLPALGELMAPLGELAEQYGPMVLAWAEEAGAWLGEKLPVAIAALKEWWAATWPEIQAALEAAWAIAEPILQQIAAWMEEDGPGALGELGEAWGEVWGFIQEEAAEIIGWIQENLPLIQEAGQVMLGVWKNRIVPALDNVWNIIKAIISIAIDLILGILKVAMQIITGDWEGAWTTVQETAAAIWENLKTIFNEFIEGVLNAMGTTMEEFKATWQSNWDTALLIVSTIWQNMLDGVREKAQEIYDAVAGKIQEIIGWIEGKVAAFSGLGAALMNGLKDGVMGAVQGVIDTVIGAINSVIDAATNLLDAHSPSRRTAAEIGEPFGEGIGVGLERAMGRVRDSMGGLMDGLVGVGGGLVPATVGAGANGAQVAIYGPIHVYGVQDARGLIEELQELAG